jgi:uncharacterized protein
MVNRALKQIIIQQLKESNKVAVVYGPRQVGKTTLMRQIANEVELKVLHINADLVKYHDVLSSRDLGKMDELIGDHQALFIDEAQNINNIGINLKILYDERPNLRIIATGSSSFELANTIKEPLTGRTTTYRMFPIAMSELVQTKSRFELKESLESYMLFGTYPDILSLKSKQAKVNHLRELASSYLYKDVLQLSNIKHSDKLYKLLQLIAFQAGSLVSVHELAKTLGMSHDTVNEYIDLMEKGFILSRLSGYSKNPRKEISKMDKIYFHDLGVRNMLIENFNPLNMRTDVGALWENFLFLERMKKCAYQDIHSNIYFWRTYAGAELDYIEASNDRLQGYEFKWGGRKSREPRSWLDNYQGSTYTQINRENYLDFIL